MFAPEMIIRKAVDQMQKIQILLHFLPFGMPGAKRVRGKVFKILKKALTKP